MSNMPQQRQDKAIELLARAREALADLDDEMTPLKYEIDAFLADVGRGHRNHHDETIVPGRAEDGEAGYLSADIRAVLSMDEVPALADFFDGLGHHPLADQIRNGLTRSVAWEPFDDGPNDVERCRVNGYTVIASNDDEGPMGPAFYWCVETDGGARVTDGWAVSAEAAKNDAVWAASKLEPGDPHR